MNLVEMFEEYSKEKGFGPRILHFNDVGFAVYHLNKNGECYIEDIFVVKDKRCKEMATIMANNISGIAKENNCHVLTGSVVPSANGSDASRKVLLSYGFKLFEESEDFEKYSKEI